MSDFPTCTDCVRRNIETYGGRCWSCDRAAARAQVDAAERARVVGLVRAAAKTARAEMGLSTEGEGLRGDMLWQLADRIEEGT